MSNLPGRWLTAAFSMAVMLTASPTHAQLTSTVYVSGLSNPVAFVQDPSNAAVQYVVQQRGLIRVVQNGTILPTAFLNLTSSLAQDSEQGLLGLAFPPNYGSSGRFYVCFTNTAGHIVVARFNRSNSNPLVANTAS
ncbi:MAG: glucose dehydrogenase, partial [Vicinamibacterales bacterium]